MKYHELDTIANRSARRKGRGIAAGQGKTAGRGTKGQKSRAGSGRRPGFEGGQNPLMQRLPKLRGFRAVNPKAEVVYTGQLDALGANIDNFTVADARLVSSPYVPVKLVVKGDVTKKITVSLQGASVGAAALLQKKGGSFKQTAQVARQKQEKTKE
ncbi:MAG TPA: 50S ribosomal protein L15 [Candidatus Saccharimonadales bacterium]|nr:50S ribosomal protein L15 [Candidatus Saccharimonadales bacterium]